MIETIRDYAMRLRGTDRGARAAWEAVADELDAMEKRADAFEAQVMKVIRKRAGFMVAPEDIKVLRDANGKPMNPDEAGLMSDEDRAEVQASMDKAIDEAVDEAVDDAFD